MAHFLRPVPINLWAANPPGSRDFTYFSRLTSSRSSAETVAPLETAAMGKEEVEEAIAVGEFHRRGEAVRGRRLQGEYKVLLLEETWEEKDRAEKATVREESEEVAISTHYSSSPFLGIRVWIGL
ncbi:hypothetical protein BHE74_00015726 [Ensete ventricosum]|nr:hypothetical protein BHE74_00015726 [Ensete ventricosum]